MLYFWHEKKREVQSNVYDMCRLVTQRWNRKFTLRTRNSLTTDVHFTAKCTRMQGNFSSSFRPFTFHPSSMSAILDQHTDVEKVKKRGTRKRKHIRMAERVFQHWTRTQLFFSPFFFSCSALEKCVILSRKCLKHREKALSCCVLSLLVREWVELSWEWRELFLWSQQSRVVRCDVMTHIVCAWQSNILLNLVWNFSEVLITCNYANSSTWTTWANCWIFFFMLGEAICCWTLFNNVSDDKWTLFSYPFTKRSMKNSKVSALSNFSL